MLPHTRASVGSYGNFTAMSSIVSRFAKGLSALIGVVLGIAIYYEGMPLLIVTIGLALLAVAGRGLARALVGVRPTIAANVIEVWALLGMALTGLSTSAVLWLSLYFPTVLTGGEAEVTAVSGALVGAITTYFATVWTKEVQGGDGPFTTGAAFKTVLRSAFEGHKHPPTRMSLAYKAIYDDRVPEGPRGWNWPSRRKRAKIIAAYYETRRQ